MLKPAVSVPLQAAAMAAVFLATCTGCHPDRSSEVVAIAPGVTLDEGAIVRGPRNAARLALVFTGGDYGEGTSTILDELAARHVRASFFLTGGFLNQPAHATDIRRMIAEGHYVGPHSDAHLLYCSWEDRRRTLVSEARFRSDLERNIDRLARFGLTRGQITFFLPPFEWYNPQVAAWTRRAGLVLVNYTPGTRSNSDYLPDRDPRFIPSDRIYQGILDQESRAPDGLRGFLLLLHLGAGPGRLDKMHRFVGPLLDDFGRLGYSCVRIDELLAGRRGHSRACGAAEQPVCLAESTGAH
jgi:peptidoglycan/xylan/chitin deacetylase (PgdA/CDA1 family)